MMIKDIALSKRIRFLCRSHIARWAVVIYTLIISLLIYNFLQIDWNLRKVEAEGLSVQGEVVGGSIEDGDVLEVHFKYEVDGREYYTTSFLPYKYYLVAGDEVNVMYLQEDPSIAYVWGSINPDYFPIWVFLLIFCVPIATLLFLFGSIKEREQLRILRNGEVSYGALLKKRYVPDNFEKKRMYRLVFRYKLKDGGMMKSQIETFRVKQTTDEAEELLVYHRKKPQKFTLVDDFPDYLRGDIRNAVLKLS